MELIEEYLGKADWRVKENSNMGFSLQGLNNYLAANLTADYWLEKVYPPVISRAHRNCDLHIHDLQQLSSYCCGWDLKDLLMQGLTGVYGKTESAPAKHFRTALGQIVNFLYTLQGEVAGAQAFSSFDTLLAPFVRFDGLAQEDVTQAMQEFVFNMNVPTRVGFQTPFTNITMDVNPTGQMAEEYVVVGGEIKDEQYKDFQKEMDMINIAFTEVMMKGDAASRVFTFPIPTYNITEDFSWDSEVSTKIFEMTAKYGIPYFSNFINSDMDPDDARSMCPLHRDEKVLIKSSGGRGLEYSSIGNIVDGNSNKDKYDIYSDGKFISGTFNKFESQEMIEIELINGHKIKMSKRHLNFVKRGEGFDEEQLEANELEAGMYLPYSTKVFEGNGGLAHLGYFVGAFAGDGSYEGDTTVVFSLNKNKKALVAETLIEIAKEVFGANCSTSISGELLTLKIHSREAVALCKDYVEGAGREKRYKAKVFGTYKNFRKNIINGHYDTDGGSRNRIYTSSNKMVETLNMLCATLGTTTSIIVDEREGRLSEHPNYCVKIIQEKNKKYGDRWFKDGDRIWFRIKNIKGIGTSTAYCFETDDDSEMFTVGTTGILTHNCRLRLDKRELQKRGGGLFGANPLTGSIGVVTINLPRLGYKYAGDIDKFTSELDRLLLIAKDSLEIKRVELEKMTNMGMYPYVAHYLKDIKDKFGKYWENHFSTIGIIGMEECAINFMNESITEDVGHDFAMQVLSQIRARLKEFQDETGNLYNLEATPAEGTTRRLATEDTKEFGDIITASEEGTPFYTNSTQLPVNYTDDIFDALDLQDELQIQYTGGTVFHTYLGEAMPSAESVRSLVKKISYNYKLPYFTITPTFSICPKHGYLNGEHEYCPKCDEENGYKQDKQL